MGSEKKSKIDDKKEEKKKKKRITLSKSEDSRKSKRRRTVADEEGKSSKSEKKERSKKRKHHHTDKDKKKKEKRKSKRDKHGSQPILKFHELSSVDYFSKNNEFATWLKEEKDMFFSELSSESARDLFSEFVKDWNSGKLESRYYEGIETGPRSAHNWKIRQ